VKRRGRYVEREVAHQIPSQEAHETSAIFYEHRRAERIARPKVRFCGLGTSGRG